MAWQKFNPTTPPKGVIVKGDPDAPPTRWYNHLWLVLFGWKTQALFVVHTDDKPFRIGFRNHKGDQYLNSTVFSGRRLHEVTFLPDGTPKFHWPAFRAKIGHEACTFFAIGLDGKEIKIEHLHSGEGDFYIEIYDPHQCPLL